MVREIFIEEKSRPVQAKLKTSPAGSKNIYLKRLEWGKGDGEINLFMDK